MKEMRSYFKYVKKYLLLFIVVAIIGVGAVSLYSQLQKGKYQGSATLYVSRDPEPRTDKYYTYEGYYAELMSKDYTDVAVALLGSSDFQHASEAQSGVGGTKISVVAKKLGPQLISLTVVAPSADSVKKLTQALVTGLNEKSKTSQNQGADLTLINSDFPVTPKSFNLPIYLAIALAGSLIFTIVVASIREYLLA